MCGILGSFSALDRGGIAVGMRAGLKRLAHRGPDDEGIHLFEIASGTLAFGHRRLSIIDLSSGGHQPMFSADGRYAMVFNGEIYNYRELRDELRTLGHAFRSDSDSEVLLAAWVEWGAGCLSRLIGMFAFVVLDNEACDLTLARDAFGIKPLFYILDETGFAFGSEIPAMLSLGCRATENDPLVYDYLVRGRYDDSAETLLAGIERLPPAHLLTIDLTALAEAQRIGNGMPPATPSRWWWPSIAERRDLSFVQAAEQLRELFLTSVRLHLRSDVPVGAALSGGIDSSAVVCAMRYLEPEMDIHTFSFVAEDPRLNEEKWIDLVNNAVGAIPHKVRLQSDRFARDIFDVVATQGEPFGTTSIYAQYEVAREARACGMKVLLNGQGADETLGGYEGYPTSVLRTMIEERRWGDALRFVHAWRGRFGHGYKTLLRTLLSAVLDEGTRDSINDIRNRQQFARFLRAEAAANDADHRRTRTADGHRRRLSQTLRDELTVSRLPRLLRYDDRNAMRWSIESRVPFLTVPLAEFLLSMPESWLISPAAQTKHLFRRAMDGIVPRAILDRSDKIGFDVPEMKLVAGAWPAIRARVSQRAGRLLDRQEAIARLDHVFATGVGYDGGAWRMINLMIWQDRLVQDSLPTASEPEARCVSAMAP